MSSLALRCAVGASLAVVGTSGSSLAQTAGKAAQSAPASSLAAPATPPPVAPAPGVIGQQAPVVAATAPGGTVPVHTPAAPGAGPPPAPSGYWYYGPPAQELRSSWYGWQTLTVDGSALVFLMIGASLRDGQTPFALLSAATYLLVPPGIHFAHGNPAKGVGSFLLRGGAPILGALAGGAAENCSSNRSEYCGLAGGAVGALVGFAAAITIDAAVLAREDSPAEPPPPTGAPRLNLLPVVGRDVHGLAVGGVF